MASRQTHAAHRRKLSQDSQHLPLHPRQPAGFDPRKMRSTLPRCIRSISTSCYVRQRSPKDVREHYDKFVFHRLYHRLKDFCIVDLSAIYFDVLKDRLYTSAPKSLARRSAQTALWRLGEALMRLLAPVTSFSLGRGLGILAGRRRASGECARDPVSAAGGTDGREMPEGFESALLKLIGARCWGFAMKL